MFHVAANAIAATVVADALFYPKIKFSGIRYGGRVQVLICGGEVKVIKPIIAGIRNQATFPMSPGYVLIYSCPAA